MKSKAKQYLYWLQHKIDRVEQNFEKSRKKKIKTYWEGYLDALILCYNTFFKKIEKML